MSVFKFLFNNRNMLRSTCIESIKTKFVGNSLGLFWLFLYPILFLAIYYTIFVNILQVRIPGLNNLDYILLIFSGLVPFLCFSESFSVGTNCIIANRNLLKNTLFPLEIIVAKDIIASHVCMGIGMLIVWITVIIFHGFYWSHLIIPFIFFLQILMTMGIVWITSTLTVFFRDLQQATPILILLLMMISPIAYTHDMVPASMKPLLNFNPLAFLMKLYRSAFFDGTILWKEFLIYLLIAIFILKIGFFFISRLKITFSNYV